VWGRLHDLDVLHENAYIVGVCLCLCIILFIVSCCKVRPMDSGNHSQLVCCKEEGSVVVTSRDNEDNGVNLAKPKTSNQRRSESSN
jgi:hypothetical protein